MRFRPTLSAIRAPRSAIAYAPRAFTLIEMLISLSVMAIIMAALGSTIVLASRALDHEAGPGAATVAARRVTDRMLAELGAATAFSERSATAVAFTVPDRDADGLPESIRYAWSGTAGAPLTRQYNDKTPDVVAEDVREFDLSYLLRTPEPPTPAEVEGPEQVLIAHDAPPSGSVRELGVNSRVACGAYFKPSLPADAVRWKVTRVEVFVRRAGLSTPAPVIFDITDATATGRPGGTVLATSSVSAGALPLLPQWRAVAFSSDAVTSLTPGQALCLVARTNDTSAQAAFQYEDGGTAMAPGTHWLAWSRTSGWTGAQDTADLRFRVWGTVTTTAVPK